jgi:cardiolipin synthase
MSLQELTSSYAWPYLAALLGFVLALVLLAHVLRGHERQSASLAWVLAILLLPFVAVPAYLVFAGRKLALRARGKRPLHSQGSHEAAALSGIAADVEGIVRGYGLPAASGGNRLELITDGERAYEELTTLIDGAERSIHVATFVLSNDRVGRALITRLAQRAQEGLEVRLLVDALGSLWARPGLLPALRRAGGHTGVFMRVLPVHRRWRANLRNHRKLALFDDRVALVGGMNLARRYMGTRPWRGRWVDTLMRIEGPVVADLAGVFADDWEFATDERFEPRRRTAAPQGASQVAQVVPSGPDVEHDALYDAIIAALYKARRRVWLVTPYFVPDDGLMRVLLLQARMGVDVRVIVPKRSDHRVADLARARFVRRLHGAGAHCLVHEPRMIHAKHLLVDDALAIAGSANLDMRSLYLNYELALFCYDHDSVQAVAGWMESLMSRCSAYRPREPGPARRLVEDLCWLAGPML